MTFNELNIINRIQKSLILAGYSEPTPIKVEDIPLQLEKKDILGSAQTGTGKTAAFAIPILQNIYADKNHKEDRLIKALVLTPTRELATQISENFTIYAKYLNIKNTTIYGGVSQKRQEEAIKRGVDILVATPGRLQDLMNQGIIELKHVEYLVLDEADQMLDMGFIKDVLKIVSKVPKNRQTMLFSATMPKSIEALAKEILVEPTRIAVTPVTQTLDVIEQSVYHVAKKQKTNLLLHLIREKEMKSVLVFTRTKHNANKLVKELITANCIAEPIHGSKSQSAREKALLNFKSGKTKILVATDIAARGIDIDSLDFVINYDLPQLGETYIHRIGRTGRAGLSGRAISFCDPAEKPILYDIEKHIKAKIKEVSHDFVLVQESSSTKPEIKNTVDKTPKKKSVTKHSKLPDHLKFKDYKKSKDKNQKDNKKKENKTFVEYQKKKNPFYQTKNNK